MNKGDIAVMCISVAAIAVLIAMGPIYSAGFKDGTAAANGVCKITCIQESDDSKEIRRLVEKKTLEALRK